MCSPCSKPETFALLSTSCLTSDSIFLSTCNQVSTGINLFRVDIHLEFASDSADLCASWAVT